MKPTRILKPPAAAMGLLILLEPPLQAGECMRLCNPEFLKTATASALQTEIDKGADINGRDDNLNTPLHSPAFGAIPARCAPCWRQEQTRTSTQKAG